MGIVKKSLITGLGFAALCSGQALAQDEAKPEAAMDGPPGANSVNINPLGVLFGAYSVNYERLFDRQHGLLVEGIFSSSERDGVSSSESGALVGYRWHWSQSQDSGFLGANLGYSFGTADAKVDGETFDVSVSAVNLTLNGGRRYAWDGGFNLTWRLGVGRAFRDFSTTSDDPDAKQAVEDVEEFFDILPITFDAELSIGWIF